MSAENELVKPKLLLLPFYDSLSGTTRMSRYQKKIHPLTMLIINHPLSASSIYYDQ